MNEFMLDTEVKRNSWWPFLFTSRFLCFICLCVNLLGDDGGHWDFQELLFQWDKWQEACVVQTQQLQHSRKTEQYRNPWVLHNIQRNEKKAKLRFLCHINGSRRYNFFRQKTKSVIVCYIIINFTVIFFMHCQPYWNTCKN